jgi:hypothetical protein
MFSFAQLLSDENKLALCAALAGLHDFFTADVLDFVSALSSPDAIINAFVTFYPRIRDIENVDQLSRSLSVAVRQRLRLALARMDSFNPSNPTGRYKLNLKQSVDRQGGGERR